MNFNVLEEHPSLAPGVVKLISDKLAVAQTEIRDLQRRLQQSATNSSSSGVSQQIEIDRLKALYERERHRGRILEDNQRIAEERAEALQAEAEAQKKEAGTLQRVQKSLEAAETKIRNLKRVNEALRRKLEAASASGSSNPARPNEPEEDAESLTLVASASEKSGIEILDLTTENETLRRTLEAQQAASDASASLLESEVQSLRAELAPACGNLKKPQASSSISTASRPRYLRPEVVITRVKSRTSSGSSSAAAAQKRPHETRAGQEDSNKKRRIITAAPHHTSQQGIIPVTLTALPPISASITEHSRQLRELAAAINEDTFNQGWFPFLTKLQGALDQLHPELVYVCPKPICWPDESTRRRFEKRNLPHMDFTGMPILGAWFSGSAGDGHQFKLAIMTTPNQNADWTSNEQLKPALFNMWAIMVAKGPEGTPNSQRAIIMYTSDLDPERKLDKYVQILKSSRRGSLHAPVWKNLPPNESPHNGYRFPHTLNWLVGLVEKGLESRWEAQRLVFLQGFQSCIEQV